MSTPVVLIGNDIHLPRNEMATWQAQIIRGHFQLSDNQIISLQSRKEISLSNSETIIPGNSNPLVRLRQLATLAWTVLRLPPESSRIIHYIGNGNVPLRVLLSILARVSRRRLLLSPFGNVFRFRLRPPDFAVALHEKSVPVHGSERWRVIPPSAERIHEGFEGNPDGPLLFASVPPKAREMEERGIPELFRCFRQLRTLDANAKLLIVNRYPHMTEVLGRLRSEMNLEGVEIRTGLIEDMPKLLRTCSVLVIPYSASHLSQVPLSAVEALSAGVPCIIASGLALAFDVKNAAAGEIFENPEEFNQAFQTIKASYNTYCESARGMAERYFDARKNLSALSSLYTLLERHEI